LALKVMLNSPELDSTVDFKKQSAKYWDTEYYVKKSSRNSVA